MYKNLSQAIEDYANKSIPRSEDAFGQFMYHAELIDRGHMDVSKQDRTTLPDKYLKILKGIIAKHMK